MTVSPILWELSSLLCHELLYTITILVSVVSAVIFSGAVIEQNAEPSNIRTSQRGSVCIFLIDTSRFHISNFTIVFGILRNPFPVKTVRINQRQAGKCWHFLFAERTRMREATYNYTIVFYIS